MSRAAMLLLSVLTLVLGLVHAPAAAQEIDDLEPPTGTDPVMRAHDTGSETPVLVRVETGEHEGFDRVVFEWDGPLPGYRIEYVDEVREDGSGRLVELEGDAALHLRFGLLQGPGDEPLSGGATAHDEDGVTFGPTSLTPRLPALKQVELTGDFEGVVSFGLGVDSELGFRAVELSEPSRLAIDVAHPVTVAAPAEFTDVEGTTHADNIRAITAEGITKGCNVEQTRFCPDEPVTRAQMASFLVRALDLPPTDENFFPDDDGTTHEDSINALAAADVTRGCGDGDRYCLTGDVRRAQMASFLVRAFELPSSSTDMFFDDEDTTHEDNINALAAAGVTTGCDQLESRFCPSQPVLRGQMASFLARALGLADPVETQRLLQSGDEGEAVRALQDRLEELGYWVGPKDGVYGTLTEQAVYAFQKVNGLARDGIFGPATWVALQEPRSLDVRSSNGFVVEVNEARQVLALVRDGRVEWIFNASTGTEDYYTYAGTQYLADTPNGRWQIYRQVDGWRVSHLGELWRPKYFHTDGIAIHGYTSVPPYPASHGCVRVSMAAMNWMWANDVLPIGTDVWVY